MRRRWNVGTLRAESDLVRDGSYPRELQRRDRDDVLLCLWSGCMSEGVLPLLGLEQSRMWARWVRSESDVSDTILPG